MGRRPRYRPWKPSITTMACMVRSMVPPLASRRVLATVSGSSSTETPARAAKPMVKDAAAPSRASATAPWLEGERNAVSLFSKPK